MKIPFVIETQFNKIFKPQLVTVIETRINGKLSKKFYGKSLTANFLQCIYAQFCQNNAAFANPTAFFSAKNTVKTTSDINSTVTSPLSIDSPAGDITEGIIIGTGITAPVPTDIAIETVIAHGAGAGQMNYGVQQGIQGTEIAGANSQFIINRTFNNNSGGAITVNECAIYSRPTTAASVFCIYRDLIAPGDVVNDGQVYDILISFNITT